MRRHGKGEADNHAARVGLDRLVEVVNLDPKLAAEISPQRVTLILSGPLRIPYPILLVLGLFTRPAAFVASGHMAFAYFIGHAGRNFFPALNNGDAAILFCFIFLYIAAAGPGPWSLDATRRTGDALATPDPLVRR